ncbi:MAG: pyridoxal phosphate-dependent aminotransferase, partial [Acidobacteriota bacterium]
MTETAITRRGFGVAAGAAAGAALLDLAVRPRPALARLAHGMPEDMIQLNSNENPYGPSKAAREAMARSFDVASRYPGDVEQEVRITLAAHHGVTTEHILLACGSGEILRLADATFLGPGQTLVVAEPTFEAVLTYSGVTRAEAITVPLDADFRHDLAAMAKACDSRTGLVYVCNPNNPTGTLVGGDDLAAFLAALPASATVLVDEAYHHFVESAAYRSAVAMLASRPNLVVARTFSKIYGLAGMRLGYAIASPENVDAMRAHAAANRANAAVLAAALASLRDAGLVPAVRTRLNETRAFLCGELARDGRRFIPSEANFVMVELGTDVEPVIAAFKERKILVGRKFPSMPTWLRVSIGTPAETAAF